MIMSRGAGCDGDGGCGKEGGGKTHEAGSMTVGGRGTDGLGERLTQ